MENAVRPTREIHRILPLNFLQVMLRSEAVARVNSSVNGVPQSWEGTVVQWFWAEVTSSIIMIVIPLMHNWKQKMKKTDSLQFAFSCICFFAKNLLTQLNGTFASLATKRKNTQSIACEKSAQESVLHWVEHCKWRSAKWRSSYVNILCH